VAPRCHLGAAPRWGFKGHAFLFYADDLAIYTYDADINKSIERLNVVLSKLETWSKENSLLMNYAKTEYMIFHKSQDTTLIPNLTLCCNGESLVRVKLFKYLGVTLDPHLNFNEHLNKVNSKVSLSIGRVNAMKRKLNQKAFNQLINAYVLSNIDFCLSVWAVHTSHDYVSMQKKINRLIRIFFNPRTSKRKHARIFINSKYKDIVNSYTSEITELWEYCNMHSIEERIQFYILQEVHKTMYIQSSHVLKDYKIPAMDNWFLIKTQERSYRHTGVLEIKEHSSQIYKKSFVYRAINHWNKMIRDGNIFSEDFQTFKKNIALWVMKDRDMKFLA